LNQLSLEKRAQIVSLLSEGNSIRSCERITGVDRNTILKILETVGKACEKFHQDTVVNLEPEAIECDEIWSFVQMKERNKQEKYQNKSGIGDAYTWIAMDAKSKLVICWLTGKRDNVDALRFMMRLKSKLSKRTQITTDGLQIYIDAVKKAFHRDVDYAQIQKIFKPIKNETGDRVYSTKKCVAVYKRTIIGTPKEELISNSYIERQNLNIRMNCKRFTRGTNAFSKKFENHCYALALQFFFYNFVRINRLLQVTPAMEAGIIDDIMTAEYIVRMAYYH
jgi:IS1 family transposase